MSKPIDQEREAFEAAYLKAYYPGVHCGKLTAPHVFTRVEYPVFQVQHKGDYERSDVQLGWVMWQARAAVQPAGVAVPEGWKLVPIDPTVAMRNAHDAAVTVYSATDSIAGYRAMLAAAPHPVSGEQKAANLRFPTMLRKMWSGGEVQEWIDRQGPLYAYPPVSPDVAGLVEILDSMVCAYRSAIATGYDRITGLGGQCDAVDYMLAAFPDYAKAKAMVAAHRAQAQGGAQ